MTTKTYSWVAARLNFREIIRSHHVLLSILFIKNSLRALNVHCLSTQQPALNWAKYFKYYVFTLKSTINKICQVFYEAVQFEKFIRGVSVGGATSGKLCHILKIKKPHKIS